MKQIPLTQEKVALVDDADFDWLNQWKWCASKKGKTFYASRNEWNNGNQKSVFMHSAILGANRCDHKDRNGLNNTRNNLRPSTRSQNASNRPIPSGNKSGFKGVSWHNSKRRWRAAVTVNRKQVHLGYYQLPILATHAYDLAATKFFGEFALTNKQLGLVK